MKIIKKFINKNWFILLITIVALARILLSCNLPSFYINNLRYDDKLMINQSNSLNEGNYLGEYSDLTLVKGIIYPMFLHISNIFNLDYGMLLTIMYIIGCLYFVYSLNKIIKNKLILTIIYVFTIFNPISYSSDLFQRLYRNSLSIIELLFFFGTIINIISSKKDNIINYIFLGIITGTMFLTREDNIWVVLVYAILIIYKLYKGIKIKNILLLLTPVLVTSTLLNIVCYINYKNYGIYTYNELSNSNFKKAYIKILQIKDEKKIDKTSIPKSTLYKLVENSKIFNLSKEYIDIKYKILSQGTDEIYNGNMIWYLRFWIYQQNKFKNGEDANKYFERLSNEIDELFIAGKLEKEFVIPSVNIHAPTINEIKELPKNLIYAIYYTTTYKNVKTFSTKDIIEKFKYNKDIKAYYTNYSDYHNAENIIDNNPIGYEIIRNIYKYFTIIFSLAAFIIYIKHIKVKDKLNLILHIFFIVYLTIICGVTYTHTTAFDAIRYCYLGNIYILQNLFIFLNLYRIYDKNRNVNESKLLESGGQNDFSNNSSI